MYLNLAIHARADPPCQTYSWIGEVIIIHGAKNILINDIHDRKRMLKCRKYKKKFASIDW